MIDAPPEPPPAQEQVIEQKLLDCGLTAGGFTVRYEDYLQSIEVVIRPAAGAVPAMFGCIHDAAFPEIVRFEDLTAFGQYMAFEEELFRPEALARGEADLKARGLWDALPDRAASTSLEDYVRALEVYAGFAPGTVLKVEGDRLVSDPQYLNLEAADFLKKYEVLFSITYYVAAKERLTLGFYGNDKVRD